MPASAAAQTPIAQTVATNLVVPWSLAFTPDRRLLVAERPGRVRLIQIPGGARTAPVIDLTNLVVHTSEGGLCGMTVDPDFANNHYLYVFYTYRVGTDLFNRIERLVLDDASFATRDTVLMDGIPTYDFHVGGRIKFGPDGMLYVTTGDGTYPDDAQDLTSLRGKLLRMTRDGTAPPDNPFPDVAPFVYSYGHRNAQGIAWDSSGQLYATEHGPSGEFGRVANDEVNLIVAGGNYGWPTCIGICGDPRFIDPIRLFDPDTAAPAGATFYNGTALPMWTGSFFFGTLGLPDNTYAHHVHRIMFDMPGGSGIVSEEIIARDAFGRVRDVIEGPDGFIYLSTSNRDGRGTMPIPPIDDQVIRIRPQ